MPPMSMCYPHGRGRKLASEQIPPVSASGGDQDADGQMHICHAGGCPGVSFLPVSRETWRTRMELKSSSFHELRTIARSVAHYVTELFASVENVVDPRVSSALSALNTLNERSMTLLLMETTTSVLLDTETTPTGDPLMGQEMQSIGEVAGPEEDVDHPSWGGEEHRSGGGGAGGGVDPRYARYARAKAKAAAAYKAGRRRKSRQRPRRGK